MRIEGTEIKGKPAELLLLWKLCVAHAPRHTECYKETKKSEKCQENMPALKAESVVTAEDH